MEKRKRVEKGILGVPKRQMLFSFSVRKGEEWSSDSEDSDYCPSDEEINVKKRKTNRKHVPKKQWQESSEESNQKNLNVKKNGSCSSSGIGNMELPELPEEILLKIFQHAVNSQGALPLLVRASKVCTRWRCVANDPTLWKTVDLSFGWIKSTEVSLRWLCENRLKQCQDINLTHWNNLTLSGIRLLTDSCENLSAINISHCKKMNSEAIITLAENCRKLTSVDLSFTPIDAVSLASLKILLPKHGPQLKLLNIGGNSYKAFASIFNLILTHCSMLEIFDLSNCSFSTDIVLINVKKFQDSCPNLQILGFANTRIDGSAISSGHRQAQLGCFFKLEQLSVAYNKPDIQPRSCLSLDFVTRVLHDSPELKLLDIRGNKNLDCHDLCEIPLHNLQFLHASNTSTKKDGTQLYRLTGLFHMLRKTLLELDISWSNLQKDDIYCSLRGLIETVDSSPLKRINLAGTNVTKQAVTELLNKCENLNYINLTSCRGMARGVKREFSERKQVIKLNKMLDQDFNSDSSD